MATYLSIKKSLLDYIKSNDLKVGDKLPTESEFAERLGVSRLTLREVLKVLREEGLIYTIHGSGTFISGNFKSINDTIDINLGISEMITAAGYKPGVKLFEKILVKASAEVANAFQIPEGSDVLVCKRVRTADDKPVVYSIDYFSPALVTAFLATNDDNISIYKFIEIDMGLKIGNSYAEIVPIECNLELSKKLDYQVNKPIFMIRQLTSDIKGSPLLFTEEYIRPDRFKISLNRRRIKL
jgi:GntR family transcriptional regulator